jgi:hypothetical protein|tara:strand:- start:9748 stop:9921 length:174 start_codon:yes stop_codon:yes gene_type:complete
MDILDRKTDKELLQSMIAELAKVGNELKCARNDLDKATSRQRFLLVLAHKMIERNKD